MTFWKRNLRIKLCGTAVVLFVFVLLINLSFSAVKRRKG